MNTSQNGTGQEGVPIAIIGMGCLFPTARDLSEYWRMIRNGDDGITDTPSTHWSLKDYLDADPKAPDMTYCGRGGFVPPIPFDPTEFGIPPTILEATDTAQLLSLVVAKAALQDAGYGEAREFNRERVSVILGVTGTQELVLPLSARLGHPQWRRALAESGVSPEVAENVVRRISDSYVAWQENSFPGLLGNVVAGRIANRLNLRGTNCVVDAACAGSLGAMHMAMMELQSGRCDMSLTGGADTLNDIFMYMCFSKTTALSFTGDARPFSDDADGTVIGEGVGILVLKRLEDAERDGDRIYAVIRNIGTSSDGRSQSIYSPHPAGQARALRDAYRRAGFHPETVELIEAHGTGTKVGDVAEFDALKTVFREAQSDGCWCALGSVKSQIGHAKGAAAAAGIIKAALAIYNRVLPPTIKIRQPNPKLGIEDSPFYLSSEMRPWLPRSDQPRRAGVSAFGFGGSNFHAVLEEHRATLPEIGWDGSVQIVAMSASTKEELHRELNTWIDIASAPHFGPAVLAYQAMKSRATFDVSHEHRLVVVVEHDADVADLLLQVKSQFARSADERTWSLPRAFYGSGAAEGKVAFIFPGQGSQYVRMGRDLACTFPEVLAWLSEADKAGDHDERRLSDLIYPMPAFTEGERERHSSALTQTDVAQPALGAIELGMCRVLQRFGVRPEIAAGHSYGELVALCVAGRYDAATLHRLSRLRGRLMAESDGELGTMLAVKAPLDDIASLVDDEKLDVVIANRNAPTQGILSGTREAIAQAVAACESRGFPCKLLRVSGAFHSRLMEPAMGPFRQALEAVPFRTGDIPVYSNTTTQAYPNDASSAREILSTQLTSPVDFVSEIEHLHDAGARIFVEVGPRNVLTGLVKAILREEDRPHHALAMDASIGRRSAIVDLANLLGQFAAMGRGVDLSQWERSVSEPRKPKMVIPLVGANYRPERSEPSQEASRPDTAKVTPVSHRSSSSDAARSEKTTQHEGSSVTASVQPQPCKTIAENKDAPVPKRTTADQSTGSVTTQANATIVRSASQPAETSPDQTRPDATAPTPSTSYSPSTEFPPPSDPSSPPRTTTTDSGPLVEAVRLVQEGLKAMQALQQQTATAHQRFLEGQEQAHRSFQAVLEGQQQLILGRPEGASAPVPAPVVQSISPIQTMAETVHASTPASQEQPKPAEVSIAPPPVGERPSVPQDGVGVAPTPAKDTQAATLSSSPANSKPEASTASVANESAGNVDRAAMESVVLEVVCEKTGYPLEMIELGMDIEGDLGVDSIKRVEIVAAIEERIPGLDGIKPEYMGSIRTLGEIVEFMTSGAPDEPSSSKAQIAPSTEPAEAPSDHRAAFEQALLAVVSELTGYPLEMLELGMDMEADLGIDSIKRVEILAAVEARMPDLPAVQPEYMGSMRTLQQVVDYSCGEISQSDETGIPPATASSHPTEQPNPTVRPETMLPKKENQLEKVTDHVCNEPCNTNPQMAEDTQTVIDRRVVKIVDLAEAEAGQISLAEGREIWVTDDGEGLANEITQRLVAAGTHARVVDASADVSPESAANVGGLIFLSPLTDPGNALWSVAAETMLKTAFCLTKDVSPGLRNAGIKGGAILATVSRMDGAFGILGGRFDPAQGGLAGLAKTAGKEWPEVRCLALDVSMEWQDNGAIAEAIVRELGTSNGPVEVGLDAHSRRSLDVVLQPVPTGNPGVSEDDVVVITGGARGVTAEAALALARYCKPTLVLMGRSPLPSEEPEWLIGLEKKAEIKKAILNNGSWPEGRPSPAVLNAEYARCLANREVRTNLNRLAEASSRLVYRSVDVRDRQALETMCNEIRFEFGPIRGLIHAAGVLADRRIQDKTTEQFNSVFDTKVTGLRCLLDVIGSDDLKHVVLFSSVSGRFGNPGQVDYSMANEVLNKIAWRLRSQLPDCRVASINWGPWDGGMVTPALKREFERQGISLIPLEAGAQCLVDEINAGDDPSVEIVIGAVLETAKPQGPKRTDQSNATVPTEAKQTTPKPTLNDAYSQAFERTLDLERHPFLRSHVLDGRAVLPVAMAMEWLGHAAMHANPGLLFHGFDNLRVYRGVVMNNGPMRLRLMVARARQSGGVFDVDVELRSVNSEGLETSHLHATAVLVASLPRAPEVLLPSSLSQRPYDRGAAGAYADVLFHGSAFQGIQQIEGYSETGLVAHVASSPSPGEWMSDPIRSDWLTDPLILDAAFQMAILWCREEIGAVSLPSRIARYRQYRRSFASTGLTTGLFVQSHSPHKMTGDFAFLDHDNGLIARIEGYECTVDSSLEAAFRRDSITAV